MRKSALSLFSHLSRQRLKIPAPFLSRNYFSDLASSSSSSSLSFRPCSKMHGFFFKNSQFQANPSRNMATFSERYSQMERKFKEKCKFEKAFQSARTSEEMLKAFMAMESAFRVREPGMEDVHELKLAMAALQVAKQLHVEGQDHEKALYFASRALKSMDDGSNLPDLGVAVALSAMGSINYWLRRFSDSLGYFDRASRAFDGLKEAGFYLGDFGVAYLLLQHGFAKSKIAMGRGEEAAEHLRKFSEILEMTLDKDLERSKLNRDLAEAYIQLLNFEDALPFCKKALEIRKQNFGENSVEVAHDRRLLALIYTGLEEHEKALEQIVLSKKVLKNSCLSSGVLRAKIEVAKMQIAQGKHDQAMDTLADWTY